MLFEENLEVCTVKKIDRPSVNAGGDFLGEFVGEIFFFAFPEKYFDKTDLTKKIV